MKRVKSIKSLSEVWELKIHSGSQIELSYHIQVIVNGKWHWEIPWEGSRHGLCFLQNHYALVILKNKNIWALVTLDNKECPGCLLKSLNYWTVEHLYFHWISFEFSNYLFLWYSLFVSRFITWFVMDVCVCVLCLGSSYFKWLMEKQTWPVDNIKTLQGTENTYTLSPLKSTRVNHRANSHSQAALYLARPEEQHSQWL